MSRNNLKKVNIQVVFPKEYDKPPKVKVLEPRDFRLETSDAKGLKGFMMLKPSEGGAIIHIDYQANFDNFQCDIYIQFCPCCEELLEKWPSFFPVVSGPGGKLAPVVPVGFCMNCGSLFVSKRTITELVVQKEKPRILSPHGGLAI